MGTVRFAGLARRVTASEAFISFFSVYSPGWMAALAGLSAAASVNALAVLTTPAAKRVLAMARPVSPGLTVTWTSAVPGPG